MVEANEGEAVLRHEVEQVGGGDIWKGSREVAGDLDRGRL